MAAGGAAGVWLSARLRFWEGPGGVRVLATVALATSMALLFVDAGQPDVRLFRIGLAAWGIGGAAAVAEERVGEDEAPPRLPVVGLGAGRLPQLTQGLPRQAAAGGDAGRREAVVDRERVELGGALGLGGGVGERPAGTGLPQRLEPLLLGERGQRR